MYHNEAPAGFDHKERHQMLHAALDELVADFIGHNSTRARTKLPSETTVMELMQWSHQQALKPTEFPRTEGD